MLHRFIFGTAMGKEKKIVQLGVLKGKVLLFGGVYSNLQALEKLKSIAEAENIPLENCICTGDIVGYCAQPEETVQFFKKWAAKSIVGNVELQLREDAKDCGCDFKKGSRCDGFSQVWFPYAKTKLSKNALEYIDSLPDFIRFDYAGKKIMVVHGSFENVSEYIFKSTPWETKAVNFEKTQSDVIIAGHCGIPFHHSTENRLWLNAGAIGMPANDGSSKVWYAVLNDENGSFGFEHHRLAYDHKLTSELMKKTELPPEYARTLITGIWDNAEILPAFESGLQGFGVQL